MPFAMSKSDQNIVNLYSIVLSAEPEPINGWPFGDSKIPLQFPPKIKTKSKGVLWYEKDATSYEPIAIWNGAQKTKISMELKYIIVNSGSGSSQYGEWTIGKVSKTLKTIMAYFYRTMSSAYGSGAKLPVVKLKMYDIAPDRGETSTWRMEDCSIAFSDEIVSCGDLDHPQLSIVTMNLAMITKMSDRNSDVPKMAIDAPNKPSKEWY